MYKLFIILFVIMHFSNASPIIANDNINTIIKKIALSSAAINCPILNFEGSTCPTNIVNFVNKDVNIIGGLGFDTIKQTTKLPILKSNNYTKLKKEEFEYHEFDKVTDLFNMLYSYDIDLAKAGIYSKREGADQLFSRFYSNSMKGTVSQKRITYFEVNAAPELDDNFQKAVSMLPEEYNEDTYNLIMEFWGDSYLEYMQYGGIFEDIRALRSCHNADVQDVKKNVDSLINNNKPSSEVRYLDYASYSQSSIYGGNPEIIETKKRMETIESNPVFVAGIKKPIWNLIKEGKVRDNIKLHIENTIKLRINKYIQDSKNRIKELFLEEAKKEQYQIYIQSYAVYNFAQLPPNYNYHDGAFARLDCIHVNYESRTGYTTACVSGGGNEPAIREFKQPVWSPNPDPYVEFKSTIDENGYYQRQSEQNKPFWGHQPKYYSAKLRSGCIIADVYARDQEIKIVPGLGWKWGHVWFNCIKCNPWIRYVNEGGQTQEYLECSCPKTV